jgi:hypothetical protein
MFSILAAMLFLVIAIMTLLVTCGLPLGEFTMGGQHKVLPPKYRIMAGISFIIQLFAVAIVLQSGNHMTPWFSFGVTKAICIFFSVYLSINTIMNLMSRSKKEKYVMTPLALVAAICFWITAFSMQHTL